jgi:sulfur carrier protein ThiS
MKILSSTMTKISFFGDIIRGRDKPISHRLMIPLSVLILGMIGGMGSAWYFQYHKNVERQSIEELHLMMREFRSLIAQQSSGLAIAIYPIAEDAVTKQGLIDKDRALLQKRWGAIYDRMRAEKVTHFYFYDAQRVCLLRLHSPDKYGDKIDRFTAKQAEILGKGTWGIELGALGMYSLRVVEPVYEGKTLIGYVELGKEIEDVLDELYFHFSHEMVLSVDKQFINRSRWEEEMRRLGRSAEWDINPDFAVSYATSAPIGRFFGGRAEKGHKHVDAGVIIEYKEKPHAMSYLPIHDASGKESAHLQVIRDISASHRHSLEMLLWIFGIGGIFFGVMVWIVKRILAQTDAALEKSLRMFSAKGERGVHE